MNTDDRNEKFKHKIRDLESKQSDLLLEIEEANIRLKEEKTKRDFYQLIADFTFGWELWFGPRGEIKYCSPSCFDITGFTANQIITSSGIADILVYEMDREKYTVFVQHSMDQMMVNEAM